MQGIRAGKLAIQAVGLGALLLAAAGCSRYAYTRVYLHGTVEDEDGRPVPFAVVRQGEIETLSDENGKYRLLYLANCLRSGVGIQGVQTPELEAYAVSYERTVLGYHLDTIETVGGGSCPADTDKFLRVTMVHPGASGQQPR